MFKWWKDLKWYCEVGETPRQRRERLAKVEKMVDNYMRKMRTAPLYEPAPPQPEGQS